MIALENIQLKNHTTLATGGPCRYFVRCISNDDIHSALAFAKSKNLDVLVLGGGSNIIIPDEGFSGVVLHVATQGVSFGLDGTVTAQAGVNWDSLVADCCRHGLSGIEALSGIPGLVGATPIQNVGAYGQDVSQVITSLQVLDRNTLETKTFSSKDCQFGYRNSRFKAADTNKWIITAVTFKLSPTESPHPQYEELRTTLEADARWSKATRLEQLTMIRQRVLTIRAAKGMVIDPSDPDTRSVGSFFTNPVVSDSVKEKILKIASHDNLTRPVVAHKIGDNTWKLSAAWLIENSGISRGQTLGGARVSTKHVLAITNAGHASTADILALANFISAAVARKFGIQLEREPVVVSQGGLL